VPFHARCDTCKTTSNAVDDRTALARERQKHRDLVHGGHRPDGEREIRTGHHAPEWIAWRVGIALVALLVIFIWISHQ
jgi:uncharacterized integral membrane protein